jgi:putative flippase GtrA
VIDGKVASVETSGSTAKRRTITREFVTFMLAGAGRAALAYGFFAGFLFFGLHYTVATLLAGAFGVLAGYVMNHRWVFVHAGENRVARFLLVFAIAYLLSVAIQRGLAASGWVDSHYLSGAIAAAMCAIPNFLMNKYFVFAPAR